MSGIRFQCSACGQHIEAPAEASGCPVNCPNCSETLRVPNESEREPSKATTPESLCAICQSPIAAVESQTACPACAANYHADCWQENGGCAVYGCSSVPEIEQRRAIEIPISYWGMENKPCPKCGFEILAAAVRCRNCGAQFSSARPEDSGEFHQREARAERLPAMKRTIVILFIFCAVPCLAPIGAIAGSIWYWRKRDEIQSMPSFFPALAKIGLALAIGQCAFFALATLLFSVFRAH